ncbi:hypothetical protein GCM10007884_35740 [Methylobacterium brachythecii]|uniref:Helix-turn-helix domain-containing protein n=2 Tax=Methylobacterium brachythecii TaxID=1176177 RepID=A0ABQ6D5F0_9HYPH|nr:hypothetical protein GCM10007884_35740 [Methylobacterium brachythecii]
MTDKPRPEPPEPYLTFRQAATALNVPYFKIQRAAKLGLIPIYKLLNSRSYVKASEIKELMRSN